MEKNYFADEFEHFLKEKTDQHRMFPSENVWNKIHRQLHVYRKWTRFGLSALLLGATVLGGKFLLKDTNSLLAENVMEDNATLERHTVNPGIIHSTGKLNTSVHPNTSHKTDQDFILRLSSRANKTNNPLIVAVNNLKDNNIAIAKEEDLLAVIGPEHLAITNNKNERTQLKEDYNKDSLSASLVIAWLNPQIKKSGNVRKYPATLLKETGAIETPNPFKETDQLTEPVNEENVSLKNTDVEKLAPTSIVNERKVDLVQRGKSKKESSALLPATRGSEKLFSNVKNYLETFASEHLALSRKKYAVQFHISPMVSYRKLVDKNNNINLNSTSGVFSKTSPKQSAQYVNHKPTLGFEAGSNILVSLLPGITLKTGLQLNLSGYQIEAFSGPKETGIYALNTGKVTGPDTIFQTSQLRNYYGYLGSQLQNHYLHLSLPIGLEWKVAGDEKLSFNIAAALQPTYLLLNKSFLLSTDYKNYSDELNLIRKWNLNSNFEAYFSFEKHGLRWQLGPQFRYQLFSSFTDQYPIREFLIDYGFKIGVSKILHK